MQYKMLDTPGSVRQQSIKADEVAASGSLEEPAAVLGDTMPVVAGAKPKTRSARGLSAKRETTRITLRSSMARAKGIDRDSSVQGMAFDSMDSFEDHEYEPYKETHSKMFFYTVEEGEQVLVVSRSGETDVVAGPAKIWKAGKIIRPMSRVSAHPGEFLIVRFKDGKQEHKAGPVSIWEDDRVHKSVECEDVLQIASKEAVVVYSKAENDEGKEELHRRIVDGPTAFIPEPGEWLHKFSWHGTVYGSDEKQADALQFNKLWLLPDQMYHNIRDVRTADDAVLTIKLMIFFELVDVEKMLEATHDPIGDLINGATSDVIEFVGRHDFDGFKEHTHQLNDLSSYGQLVTRAESAGYRINKVVYRGYGAPDSLQQMHDKAIESRTRLKLEKATEEQAQELADYKLERELTRRKKERSEQVEETAQELDQAEKRRKLERELQRAEDNNRLEFLKELQKAGVDLTKYLTQNRADKVVEVRGDAGAPHLHLGEIGEND